MLQDRKPLQIIILVHGGEGPLSNSCLIPTKVKRLLLVRPHDPMLQLPMEVPAQGQHRLQVEREDKRIDKLHKQVGDNKIAEDTYTRIYQSSSELLQ